MNGALLVNLNIRIVYILLFFCVYCKVNLWLMRSENKIKALMGGIFPRRREGKWLGVHGRRKRKVIG